MYAHLGAKYGNWLNVKGDYFEIGSNLEQFDKKDVMQTFTAKKPIMRPDGPKPALQILIDQNFANTWSSVFASLDSSYSMRDILSAEEDGEEIIKHLTTTTIG